MASKDMNEIDKLVAEKKEKPDTLGITFGVSHHQPFPASAASGFGAGVSCQEGLVKEAVGGCQKGQGVEPWQVRSV